MPSICFHEPKPAAKTIAAVSLNSGKVGETIQNAIRGRAVVRSVGFGARQAMPLQIRVPENVGVWLAEP